MRFTIERLRTVLLVSGTLLIVTLGIFLARGTWKNPFKNRDIPGKLGIDIQQEANGFTYTQTHGGRTLFKIHASKVVQLKNDHALLHDVMIELYGTDGSRVDRIEGSEFQYDQKAQVATAQGAVEITMMKPGARPAVAIKPGQVSPPAANKSAKPAPASVQSGEIHVKTSGLVFYQKTGIASTDQRVDFAIAQGSGNALGATYNSDDGHLVLDRQVTLNLKRNNEPVEIHAEHAEFDRDAQICNLRTATAAYRKGNATAGAAKILFRDDGSAQHLDASDGFTLATATGGHLAAPTGWLEFNEKNQPQRGHLEGGVTMDAASDTPRGSRQSHGSAPTAELAFTSQGELKHAHLERGVELASTQQGDSRQGPLTVKRMWRSPIADIDFRDAGKGQVEPAAIHGTGGVIITGESRHGSGPVLPSRLAADDLKVDFGPNSSLSDLTGIGHASLEETSGSGTRQTSSGDRLDAHFVPAERRADAGERKAANSSGSPSSNAAQGGAAQIETATLEGNVELSQQPAAKAGESAAAPMHATAGRADYEGSGEWIHLTQTPRVNDGNVQLSADKVDVSQASGDAFAHGTVKATSFGGTADAATDPSRKNASNRAGQSSMGLGGQGPSHVIADEAEMRKSTGESIFRGHARLWQEANSVAAPVIVLSRQRQTLVATSTNAADPVRVVMVSADLTPARDSSEKDRAKPRSPSVIRMSGGALHYSDAERKALMTAGAAGTVIAEMPTARSTSDQVELILLPPGNHAGRDGGSAQVDRMTASGHVVVSSDSRRGTGTQLVYTGDTGEYVLTGTAAMPPRMTDPARGTVIGDALIFHSRDDSVSIEGGTAKTATETHAQKKSDR